MKFLLTVVVGSLCLNLAFAADLPNDADVSRSIKSLSAKDAKTRLEACEKILTTASAGTKCPEAVTPLVELLKNDPDTKVRVTAARALSRIDGSEKQAVSVLEDQFKKEKDRTAILGYLECFIAFGPKAKDALPTLKDFALQTHTDLLAAEAELTRAKDSGDADKIRTAEDKRNAQRQLDLTAIRARARVRNLFD